MSTTPCDIGLVGLAVMGKNLVLNMEDHGYSVAVFNRTTARVDEFIAEHPDRKLHGTHSIEELCAKLRSPRKIILLVKAGPPVDDFIELIVPHLDPDDIIIDAGNSHFPDTIRRTADLHERGLRFIGTGVSGGEEGARFGPSIMPGGSPSAWPEVKDIFQAIAAKVGPDDAPCCEWVGDDGAGHYVKMVHNGIEYGDMQLICEAYFLMKESLGMSSDEMHEVFARWNEGDLESYLIEITRDILAVRDEASDAPLVEMILDTAGQKGTGRWTSESAIQLGISAPTIVEAVLARAISAQKAQRVAASTELEGPAASFEGSKEAFIDAIEKALYCSKICSYAQGYALIRAAAKEYGWKLDFGNIALLWRGGCIIRAVFLERIRDAFARCPELENLLLDPFFKNAIHQNQEAWRTVVSQAIRLGVPTPAFSSALAYYDSYRREVLPANLLQAQRDYFGSHTYRRIDEPDGEPVHTDWVGITKKTRDGA